MHLVDDFPLFFLHLPKTPTKHQETKRCSKITRTGGQETQTFAFSVASLEAEI